MITNETTATRRDLYRTHLVRAFRAADLAREVALRAAGEVRDIAYREAEVRAAAEVYGVINEDSGEILDVACIPSQYLVHILVDRDGYATLSNALFEELRGEMKAPKLASKLVRRAARARRA